ncbi:MAG: PqqD family protein [Lysobacteraceae bacterium]
MQDTPGTHAPSSRLTLDSRLAPSDDVMIQVVAGESVLLDLASEQYFGLDVIGTRIWELLTDAPTLEQVHATLCGEYQGSPERIESDLLVLAQQLTDSGLVKIAD